MIQKYIHHNIVIAYEDLVIQNMELVKQINISVVISDIYSSNSIQLWITNLYELVAAFQN